jgi:hypothetical protein
VHGCSGRRTRCADISLAERRLVPGIRRADAPGITPTDLARAAAFGAASTFAVVVIALAAAQPAAMDFIAHYAAASLVLAGQGSAILDPAAVAAAEHAAAPDRDALLPFVRPPAFALLMAPLAALPFTAAFAVTATLDAAMIAASIALLRQRGEGARGVAALLLVAPPSAIAVAHAQMSPLALFLVALALRLGPRAGGIALGLSLLRPQTAPLLVLAGLIDPSRRWWTVLGSLVVVAASAAVVGIDGLVRYVESLSAGSTWLLTGEFGLHASVGWTGLALLVGAGPLGVAASILSLAAGAFLVARCAAPERPAVAALWALLAGPAVLMHDAVLAYPTLLAATSRQRAWDVGSVAAWIGHILVAPVGVLWSLAVAIATLRRPR